MTRAITPSETEKHKISRKSHRKSRNGCDNCKRRRIKCNELGPRCSNCIKHSDQCSFSIRPPKPPASLPDHHGCERDGNFSMPSLNERMDGFGIESQATSPGDTFGTPKSIPSTVFDTPRSVPSTLYSSASISGDPRLQPMFSLVDIELFHNYSTVTSGSISGIPELQQFMRVDLPRLGLEHPFVIHCLLAVSALHMAHFKKDAREFYVHQAETHYSTALQTATSLLSNLTVHNCPAIYIFATFCSTYTMATGPQRGDFLLFTNAGPAEWRALYKGVRAIIEANPWLLRNSDLAPMFEVAIRSIRSEPSDNPHLLRLREHIVETVLDQEKKAVYLRPLEELQKTFPMEGMPRGGVNASQAVFTWLYKLDDDYIDCLQRREPVALVIFAHFCVVLHDLGSVWWLKGWVDHLMGEIYGSLVGEHRLWMRWPIEEIGWIPS